MREEVIHKQRGREEKRQRLGKNELQLGGEKHRTRQTPRIQEQGDNDKTAKKYN
ncbi:Hypothetical protein FKW44_002206 [Caligus rogercresseyi]|uniref:Uncharacterized protein n=1 Tax=Caligus rogercresseyi TaxID=217165 RepID=A0A7T8KJV4_CALRO|nr:Hypothetical protein FKW44_002206 [Caligus rogercresseyi]